MSQRESLKTSWVYTLRKDELLNYLIQCGQDSTGTVDEMRKRMAKFITTEQEDHIQQKLLNWQKHHEQNNNGAPNINTGTSDGKQEILTLSTEGETIQNTSAPSIECSNKAVLRSTPSREDRIATIDLVRKWGLRYDGGKDILKFIDRLEELATLYEVDLSEVVPVMCELLRDRALIWFRNNHKSWDTWSQFRTDFLGFFLPQRYFEKLGEEIRSRTQRPRENFKDYVLALQELMYHSKFSEAEKLEIIFRNSSPDYQWYIKRRDFETLDDLLSLAAELESIPTPKYPSRNDHHRMLKERYPEAFNTSIQCAGLNAKCDAVGGGTTGSDGAQRKVRQSRHIEISSGANRVVKTTVVSTQRQIDEFLQHELPKFKEIQGLCNVTTHRIIMKEERPIKIRYAPRNPAMQAIIDEEVNSLLMRGCIEPSRSPYSFPITLVKKKNGTWRTCMDFRQLNARSVPDAYPLPRIDTILDRLRNAKYISSLDLKDGYWQIPMDDDSKKYTAFAVTGRGLYQWRVMPFGLHSAPATFQRVLDTVIGPDMEPYAFAYLDDIIVIGSTFEEHLDNLKEVFRRLRAAKLRINVEKCEFFKSEIRYLGHVVTSEGIKTDPDKVAAIMQLPQPQDIKGIRRFLGVTSWYRRFVPNFANISQPLTQLLKKGKHWKWGVEQQQAFEALKDSLTKAPVLACPDFTKPFILQTDASDYGLGAVLTQELDGAERVIAYASRHLNGAERNYSATEKECLAIVWGIRKMRPYLEGYAFKVITDHLSLKWLNSIDNPSGRLARWALELQQYQFSVEYRKGKHNIVADTLSRHPIVAANLARTRPLNSCTWYDTKLEAVRKNPDQHADYAIINHQLYRHFSHEINDEDTTPWKLCVPTHQRLQVLEETHDQVSGGHLGIRKTLNKVATRYYWPGMAHDVGQYVRRCETCQRFKIAQQQPAGKMLTRIPDEPWSLVGADFIGPLPRTTHGNTMLLVFFDSFSKWVELIPLRKATAESVVKALRERIISRYGVPKVLITDNGTQFTSRVLQKYLEEVGVKHQYTAPYTPQENPTERANRTIKSMIAQFSKKKHNLWDELLPEIMLAINTSVSESTGYSPAFLTQGRVPRLPNALYDKVTIGSGARCPDAMGRARELKEIFHIVRRNLEKAHQKQRHYYNLRRRNWTPKIGDLVLVRQHPLSKAIDNFAAKLAPKFKGPYIVSKFVSPVIVEVEDVETREKRTAHLSELKEYHSNNLLYLLTRSSEQLNRRNKNMDANQQKFEQVRERSRQNMQRENQKGRQTIFLDDDEIRSGSRGKTTNKNAEKQKPHIKRQARRTTSASRPNREKSRTVRHCRITTVPNQRYDADPAASITISDDEETTSPPPPQQTITSPPPIPSPPPFVQSSPPIPSPSPFVRLPSPVPSPPPFVQSPSPIPSPPPLVRTSSSVPPPPPFAISPPPTVPYQRLTTSPEISPPKNPRLEDLPSEIQQKLGELTKEHEGRRLRTIQEIWGHRYRVTFKASGEIIIAPA